MSAHKLKITLSPTAKAELKGILNFTGQTWGAEQRELFKQTLWSDQFLADPRTRDAVFYNIVVVGEASRRGLMTECKGLSAEARQALAEAAAIGDRLPRQYANSDASAVWDAIQVKLPGLKRQLMHWLSARNQATETQ